MVSRRRPVGALPRARAASGAAGAARGGLPGRALGVLPRRLLSGELLQPRTPAERQGPHVQGGDRRRLAGGLPGTAGVLGHQPADQGVALECRGLHHHAYMSPQTQVQATATCECERASL